MAANYHRPKPGDPLYWRWNLVLELMCLNAACRRHVKVSVGELAERNRLPRDMTLEQLKPRLVCRCGGRPWVVNLG